MRVSSMNTSEVPFGLEPFGPELKAEGLMAERKRRGHVLSSYTGYANAYIDRHQQPRTAR